jgi:integrase
MSAKPNARHSELPAKVRSFDDVEFDPRQDVWRFRSGLQNIDIDFGLLDGCSLDLTESFRRVMLWYVQRRSASLANGIYQRFLHFIKSQVSGSFTVEISADQILIYRSNLPSGRRWYLTTLAGALRRWVAFDLPGISIDAILLLKRLRLEGNRKGEAVRTACPISGPLSDIEFSALISAVNAAYRDGALSRQAYLMASLCMTFGLRPVQLAALKSVDLFPTDGKAAPYLRIPRAKQRGQVSRDTFTNRPLIPALAWELEAHVAEVAKRLHNQSCPGGNPMFPASSAHNTDGTFLTTSRLG